MIEIQRQLILAQEWRLAPDPALAMSIADMIGRPVATFSVKSQCEKLALVEYTPCGAVDPLLIMPSFPISNTAQKAILAWRDSMEKAIKLTMRGRGSLDCGFNVVDDGWRDWYKAHRSICARVAASLNGYLPDHDAAWLRGVLDKSLATPLEV